MAKFAVKQTFFLRGNFTPFLSKSFQIRDHFFALLFSKDSQNFKSFDIGLEEVGTKRRLTEQTNEEEKT